MNLCPECFEPLDDFAPCACVLGHVRASKAAEPSTEKKRVPIGGMRGMVERGGMRGMVERKLRHRALAAQNVTITPKR